MKNIERLPDCYRKDPDSNNYKMLKLNESAVLELRQDIESVWNALDLSQATGKTLELYGYMLDQLRGSLTDDQYRHMLLAKIGRNYVKGDYQSIMDALVMMFGTRPEQIKASDFELIEGDKPCLVKLTRYPDVLEEAGFTIRQMAQMIKALLPICITLLLQFYSWYEVPISYDNAIHFQSSFHPRYNLSFLSLDRTWSLDNKRKLSGYDSEDYLDFYPVQFQIQTEAREDVQTEERIRFSCESQEEIEIANAIRLQTEAMQEIRAETQMHMQVDAWGQIDIHTGSQIKTEVWQEIATGEQLEIQTLAAEEIGAGERIQIQGEAAYQIETASYMTKMNQTDATWSLNGSRKLDGGRYVL